MKHLKGYLAELFSTRRVIALMLLGLGFSISQNQSTLINQTLGEGTLATYALGWATLLCGAGMAGFPYRPFSGLFGIPLLLYSVLNVWYAVDKNMYLPVGAFFSAGMFAIVWTDMLQPVVVIKVKDVSMNTIASPDLPPQVKTLLGSRRFRSAVIGLIAILIPQLIPTISEPRANLLSAIAGIIMGALIGSYTLTDLKDDTDAKPGNAAEALQTILYEIVTALFTSLTPAAGKLMASKANDSAIPAIRVDHPLYGVVYLTASREPPSTNLKALEKVPDTNEPDMRQYQRTGSPPNKSQA